MKPLTRVSRAAARRARSHAEYRAAILDASRSHTFAAIAQAAGTSKQAVWELVRREAPREDA